MRHTGVVQGSCCGGDHVVLRVDDRHGCLHLEGCVYVCPASGGGTVRPNLRYADGAGTCRSADADGAAASAAAQRFSAVFRGSGGNRSGASLVEGDGRSVVRIWRTDRK